MRSFIFMLLILFFGTSMANHQQKSIYGYIEKVKLQQHNMVLNAKLDTGAKSASLNATHIEKFTKDGKPFLKFIVPAKEGDKTFECPYVKDVQIKTRSLEAKANQMKKKFVSRPVVSMQLTLDGKQRRIDVNLANRERFIYPLLLGREAIIAFNGIVDPSTKFTKVVE